MPSYNRVILMGNLTRDPEVRFTSGGTAVTNASLAVNRRYQDGAGEWKEEATFIDVTIWGKRGEAFAKFHQKGRSAFVEGSLRMDTWDDKATGQKRSKLYVVADNWEFVGGEKGGSGSGGPGGPAPWASQDSAPAAPSGGGGDFVDVAEDTPF